MAEDRDILEIAKDLARETIMIALADLQNSFEPYEKPYVRHELLDWFNRRSMAPFGYGWCLTQSGMNPNDIRRGIDLMQKGLAPLTSKPGRNR